LALVLRACPEIADYARAGIAHLRDLLAAAGVARMALGGRPIAWEAAIEAMGERPGAVAIAVILQKGAAISSAGRYLRTLTRKT
jgi:replication initiation protein RepC